MYGYLESVGSRVVYELYHKKAILYVVPIQNILGKLLLVPVCHTVCETGTILHSMRNAFSGAPGDWRPGAGDGCRTWVVNSSALRWSRDSGVTCFQSHGIAARNALGCSREKGSMGTQRIAMFGACDRLLWLCSDDSNPNSQQCI